jgi:hypothetical protein
MGVWVVHGSCSGFVCILNSDRRIANPRDGRPVCSDPVAASEEEHPLHSDDCTPQGRPTKTRLTGGYAGRARDTAAVRPADVPEWSRNVTRRCSENVVAVHQFDVCQRCPQVADGHLDRSIGVTSAVELDEFDVLDIGFCDPVSVGAQRECDVQRRTVTETAQDGRVPTSLVGQRQQRVELPVEFGPLGQTAGALESVAELLGMSSSSGEMVSMTRHTASGSRAMRIS